MAINTRRENLRRLLHHGDNAWVPFAPNFAQWFGHHQTAGTLPDELREVDYIGAQKVLGCDIFSRNLDGGYRAVNTTIQIETVQRAGPQGLEEVRRWPTPHGTLELVLQLQPELSTSHVSQYPVRDWERDRRAAYYLLEQQHLDWDEKQFAAVDAAIGDDGLVNVPLACTPLKFLHHYFGLENFCYFCADFPQDADKLCRCYWAKVRPVLEKVAGHPGVDAVILMDNVDTPFYPPALAEKFWEPYVRDAAELMHAAGKLLFVHACGQLAGLEPFYRSSRLDGLEGITHPPLGDWTAARAQACHPRFIFCGGFSAHEQKPARPEDEIRAFYHSYLSQSSPHRFIFSASCQTAIETKWERIKLVRDICRAWGGDK